MVDTLSVLVVCRANVCRSPLAAHLLTSGIAAAGLSDIVVVRSAGTEAQPGAQMCEQAREWAHIDHIATSIALTTAHLERADLVLAADRETASACAILNPGCRARLLTMNQAPILASYVDTGALAHSTGAARLRLLVREMDESRFVLAGREETADDIVDRHGFQTHDEVFYEIDAAVTSIAHALDRYADSVPI